MAQGATSKVSFKALGNEGIRLLKCGQYEAAEKVLTEAIALKEKSSGEVPEQILVLRGHSADCKYSMKRFKEAEEYNRATLKMTENRADPQIAKRAAFTRCELAASLLAQQQSVGESDATPQSEEAIQLLKDCLQHYKDLDENNDDRIHTILQRLSIACFRIGRASQAEGFDREAVQRSLKSGPSYRSNIIACKERLARDLFYLRKLGEARELYKELMLLVALAADNGIQNELSVYECDERMARCSIARDRWHRAIDVVVRINRSVGSMQGLRRDRAINAWDRWKSVISEVMTRNELAAIASVWKESDEVFVHDKWGWTITRLVEQNQLSSLRGRWRFVISVIMKRNRLTAIVNTWKANDSAFARGKWQWFISKAMERNIMSTPRDRWLFAVFVTMETNRRAIFVDVSKGTNGDFAGDKWRWVVTRAVEQNRTSRAALSREPPVQDFSEPAQISLLPQKSSFVEEILLPPESSRSKEPEAAQSDVDSGFPPLPETPTFIDEVTLIPDSSRSKEPGASQDDTVLWCNPSPPDSSCINDGLLGPEFSLLIEPQRLLNHTELEPSPQPVKSSPIHETQLSPGLPRLKEPGASADNTDLEEDDYQQPALFDGFYSEPDAAATDWIIRFRKFCQFLHNKSSDETIPEIKVAVLDTGIDAEHPYIAKRWHPSKPSYGGYENFVTSDSEDDEKKMDNDGHGTHIAGLILQHAPNAKLYILRVADTSRSIRKDAGFAGRVVKALESAVRTWKVNIISMSFGLNSRVDSIRRLLSEAAEANIVLFAAASNYGNRQSVTYPAFEERVICINASDGNGRAASFNPPFRKRKSNFSIMGVSLESTWPGIPNAAADSEKKKGTLVHATDNTGLTLEGTAKFMSGTSVATPLAAALAANVLAYTRANLQSDAHERLACYTGIRSLFDDMSSESEAFQDIVPWEGLKGRYSEYKHRLTTLLETVSSDTKRNS